MQKTKVGMVSLGCSKNQVDSEIMLALIQKEGFELCTDAGLCDVVVVNTCGFIEDAKRESIENILEFCVLKNEGQIKAVVVTGCLAERYKDEIENEIPEADVILGIGSNDKIVEAIKNALNGKKTVEFGEKTNLSLEGPRIISNLPFFAYLKISDGCDNCCSYCAIPSIRGGFRSRPIESIVAEAEYFAQNGVTELVVIAQDTTRYGEDLYGELKLPELLTRLCAIEKLKWVRLLYCYPDRMTDELIAVMAAEPKIVKYIDLPLQHASGRILKLMNRRGDRQSLAALVAKLRAAMPEISLRTTFITGFPGETEADFEELCDFVKEVKFDRLGCFAYSPEEGTPAFGFEEQVDDETKRRRAEIVMDMQYDILSAKNQALLGKRLKVAVEGFDRLAASYFGRSYMDAPDVDTKLFFKSEKRLQPGDYVEVLIEDVIDYDLLGQALFE